ncbi:MAG: hypothetical protein GY821_14610, partial [Gammaproteobacteria bacterium]|nr:hypothetical protein [Gammaproteobacteria bacterium]
FYDAKIIKIIQEIDELDPNNNERREFIVEYGQDKMVRKMRQNAAKTALRKITSEEMSRLKDIYGESLEKWGKIQPPEYRNRIGFQCLIEESNVLPNNQKRRAKENAKISTAKETSGRVQENNSNNVESSTGMVLRSRQKAGGDENTGEEQIDGEENNKNNDENNTIIEEFIECGTPPKSPRNSTRGEKEEFLCSDSPILTLSFPSEEEIAEETTTTTTTEQSEADCSNNEELYERRRVACELLLKLKMCEKAVKVLDESIMKRVAQGKRVKSHFEELAKKVKFVDQIRYSLYHHHYQTIRNLAR